MKATCIIVILFIAGKALCQDSTTLDAFNREKVKMTRQSMYVLGGWGIANVVTGAIGSGTSSGSDKKFYQMNLGWGLVNATLAGFSLLRIGKTQTDGLAWPQTLQEQHKLEKLYLLNAGLDLAYLGTGAWMLEKAKNDPSSRDHWKGFGQSLLLQGGFLLVYDIINYVVHSHHGRQLYAAPAKVRLTTTAYGTGLAMNF